MSNLRWAQLSLLLVHAPVLFAEEVPENHSVEEKSLASDSSTKAPSIIITANRTPNKPKAVGSSVTLIDREEIERFERQTIVDVLRSVPGLEITQSGGIGKTSAVSLRGAASNQTLVLIDGVRVNDNSVGGFDFADITVENIERIEIIRGPQSTLYGSEAMGGVINIITRRADEGVSIGARAEGGSKGSHREVLEIGGRGNGLALLTTLSYLSTDGISVASEQQGNTEADSYSNLSFTAKTSAEFLEDGLAELSLRLSRSDSELDGFDFERGPIDDLNFEAKREVAYSALIIEKSVSERIKPQLQFGFSNERLSGSDPDPEDSFNNYRIRSRNVLITPSVELVPFTDDVLSIGYSFEHRNAVNKDNFDDSIEIHSVFLNNQWSWRDELFLSAGVRNDSHQEFGDRTSYRVALSLLPLEGSRLHSSYGTGFRAPSFNELFFPNFGNPELRPEKSRGVDVGLEQHFFNESLIGDVTLFHNSFDDLITFSSETFLAANIAEARTRGVESRLEWEAADTLRNVVSYTYTDSEDRTSGAVLPRRPRHRASMQFFAGPWQDIETALGVFLVRDRIDTDRVRMDNYERVDLTINYGALDWVTPYLRFENLFDKDYEEINGFTSPGFTFAAGANGRW